VNTAGTVNVAAADHRALARGLRCGAASFSRHASPRAAARPPEGGGRGPGRV